MDKLIMEGVTLTPLIIIENAKGDVLHCMKKSDVGFEGFGEAYFSKINKGEIKGWNKHTLMTVNLIVNIGEVLFVIYDGRSESKTYNQFYHATLSIDNYQRLTVVPGLWVAMKGLKKENIILNLANIEHDPDEHRKLDLNSINYNWSKI